MSETAPDRTNGNDPDATRFTSGGARHDDPRLFAAVEEYMAALEAGRRPHRREFLARFPEFATELAACIDGLALVHSAAGDVIPAAAPAGSPIGSPAPGPVTGQPLGDFRLVREIGRGGMGVVYEAVQLSLGRRVALKVLPFAAALDTRHLERFRNEAQAAAQLHHTNIVPVYAVGCERSVHFYAMQLIEGQSMAEVIRSLRQVARPDARSTPETRSAPGARAKTDARGTDATSAETRSDTTQFWRPQETQASPASAGHPQTAVPPVTQSPDVSSTQNLSVLRSTRGSAYARSVANLGLQVAEALEYAHRTGIVHRDIKPGNLLLDAKGTLWVTDFGLAQFYAQTDLTRTGDMLGTLRYMSPEQASGRAVVLDQRTDIYSFGATFYELLTLERALPGRSHEQLLYQLSYEDPRPARAIDKTIPKELETILAKAMAKDPADRYATAAAVAEDLRRFLHDEPILARPPSAWDTAWKWVRRHRAWAVAGVVAVTLSAAALLVSTLAIAREQANTRRAYQSERVKAIEAHEQHARAQRSWAQARDAVDFFSTVAIGMDRPEFSEVRRDMLEESLAYYQQFIEERAGDPTVGSELAQARARVTNFLELYAALDASIRSGTRLDLLREPSVVQDLQLTPDRATAALALVDRLGGGPPRPQGNDTIPDGPDARKTQFAARAKEIDDALHQTLGPRAAERLWQISRQVRGAAAFSDPDVVAILALSRTQRADVRRIQVEVRNKSNGHGPGGGFDHGRGAHKRPRGPGDDAFAPPPENDDAPTPNDTEPNDTEPAPREPLAGGLPQIVALLTPPQAMAWAALTGPPFTGHIAFQGWGGKGMGGGRGPRRGPPTDTPPVLEPSGKPNP